MKDLFQLGVRDTELPAPYGGHTPDGGMAKRVTKGVAANHSSRAHDHNTFLR